MVVDGAPEHGGRNIGPRPMELILMGLGSCASFDVIAILKKQRQEVASCECTLEAERADSVPSVFTKITIKIFRFQVIIWMKIKLSELLLSLLKNIVRCLRCSKKPALR